MAVIEFRVFSRQFPLKLIDGRSDVALAVKSNAFAPFGCVQQSIGIAAVFTSVEYEESVNVVLRRIRYEGVTREALYGSMLDCRVANQQALELNVGEMQKIGDRIFQT